MLFHKTGIVLAFVAIASVLPSSNKPRTKRISRGPAWTDFRKLAVDPAKIEAAKHDAIVRTRIAVVAKQTGQANEPSNADVAAELIRSGLRYSNGLIVMDAATTETLFNANQDQKIRDCLQAGHVGVIVLISVNAEPKKTLSVEFIRKDPHPSTTLEPIQLGAEDDALIDASIQSRTTVLEKLGRECRTACRSIAAATARHDGGIEEVHQGDDAN